MKEKQKTAEEVTKKIIEINESEVRGHLGELVRSSVEETLNGLLDAEADRLCNAQRYERNPDRKRGQFHKLIFFLFSSSGMAYRKGSVP